jgi:uncharacterized membrane protein required for colicin V production
MKTAIVTIQFLHSILLLLLSILTIRVFYRGVILQDHWECLIAFGCGVWILYMFYTQAKFIVKGERYES